MKYIFSLILCAFIVSNGNAQLSILFVDDSDDEFGNAELLASALDSLGYEYDYYDAVTEGASPDAETMSFFDLVIWMTADDGNELRLWNGGIEDNEEIIGYLDQGGKLWLSGLDFLFNRYEAPDTFELGEFVYDYLGIQEYKGQTRTDDGGAGADYVVASEDSPIPNLNTLDWIFETIWYADAVTPREDAASVYEFGSSNDAYPYNGEIAGVYYETDTFSTLTYLFNMGVVKDFAKIKENTQQVLAFFDGPTSSTPDLNTADKNLLKIYPNPAKDILNLEGFQIDLNSTAKVFDIFGNVVIDKKLSSPQLEIGSLAAGHYILNVQGTADEHFLKFIKF